MKISGNDFGDIRKYIDIESAECSTGDTILFTMSEKETIKHFSSCFMPIEPQGVKGVMIVHCYGTESFYLTISLKNGRCYAESWLCTLTLDESDWLVPICREIDDKSYCKSA